MATTNRYERLQVLVVDDESFVRTIVKQMLRALGIIHIREADEGAAALREVQMFPPDVIICDLNMEPIDGLVFVQMLRSHQETSLREIPVIILTGKADLGSVKEAASRGINAYLVKPVALQALRSRLDAVIDDPSFVKMAEQIRVRRRNGAAEVSPMIPRPELKEF